VSEVDAAVAEEFSAMASVHFSSLIEKIFAIALRIELDATRRDFSQSRTRSFVLGI